MALSGQFARRANAHPARLAKGHSARGIPESSIASGIRDAAHDLTSFEPAGYKDYHSSSSKSSGYEFDVAEKLLDLSILCVAEQGLFYDLLDYLSHYPGKQRGPDHDKCKLLEPVSA
jgi:hypothetical protein